MTMSAAAFSAGTAPPPGKTGLTQEVLAYAIGLALTIAGAVFGCAPALVWLGRAPWLPWIAGGAALLFVGFNKGDRRLRRVAGWRSLVVGLGMCVYGGAITGAMTLAFYGGGWLLSLAVRWLWHLVAVPPSWLSHSGSWASLFGLVLGLPLVVVTVPASLEWLRRSADERMQAFVKAERNRSQILTGLAIGLALTMVACFAGYRGWGDKHWILLQVALLFFTTQAWTVAQAAAATGRTQSAVDSVKALLEGAGFEVQRELAGTSAAAEPLLRKIDLVAQRGGGYLAVEVKAGEDNRPIEPTAASALCIAASALAVEKQLKSAAVRPLLVLAGPTAEPSLESSARAQRVGLLTLSSADLAAIGRGGDVQGAAVVSRLEEALQAAGTSTW